MIKKSTKVFNAALTTALSATIMASSAVSVFALPNNSVSSCEIGKYSEVTAKTANYPILEEGSQGFRVTALQYLLNYHIGAGLAANGIFDAETKNAVIEFQKSENLTDDGIVGTDTWVSLTDVIQSTSSYNTDATKSIQVILNAKISAGLTVNGIFDTYTRTSVMRFQMAKGLKADGTVDPETWKYLLS
ncbi:MAG: peptidoglycan-binding protein [Lachnospiraceae bacterium]|nr:peptidoglycan-binding protein [Lachnospiraceae bacterium]MDE6254157.1 peptidoglycan-binding protein [Lachnospiraceae bacterium]